MSKQINIALPSTGEDEWQAVKESIFSGWLTQGPKVAAFEQEFAKMHGVQHALAVTSCTTGLHLILAGLGIKAGDEVIVPAFTWIATANVVKYCGAKVVFADVSRETYNIDVKDVERKITDKTKAIIPVHLFGLIAEMDQLKSILPEHVAIVEDAACAAGAIFNNQYAGSIGTAASFSFHPRKSITTGEGGMVTTNDDELAETMDMMRNHGASLSEEARHHGPRPYILPDFNLLGFNYRMTDLQGAIGLAQIEKLNRFIEERAKWAAWYSEQLADIDWLRCPKEPENGRHSWQAFVTYVDPDKAPKPRNEIMEDLKEKGVATRPGTHAVHMLNYYQEMYNLAPDDFPGARDCHNQTMAIPLHNKMTDDDYATVVECLKAIK